MATLSDMIYFQWPVCETGYCVETVRTKEPFELVAAGGLRAPGLPPGRHEFIVPRGGGYRLERPCASEALWLELAKEPMTPEGAARFASRYGLLNQRATDPGPSLSTGEPFALWRSVMSLARVAADNPESITKGVVGPIGRVAFADVAIGLASPENGQKRRPEIFFQPATLCSAIMLQLAHYLLTERGGEYAQCENCGGLFHRGGGQTQRSRRTDAKYCSDKCRARATYENRKRGQAA